MTVKDTTASKAAGELIRVTGTVQGVGFRPTVWRLARQHGVLGSVWNDAEGVMIQAWATVPALERFVSALREQAPPLARISGISRTACDDSVPPVSFSIRSSRQGSVVTDVAPDAATCPACLAEVFDPGDRRFRYPFSNCTHCGPRLSIIGAVPYDRVNTSMAPFVMCPACQGEYDDPSDRRFHAQPNACARCGPEIWLEDSAGIRFESDPREVIDHAASLLQQGAILGIKGIGGIHLACDACDSRAVNRLRQRKRRYHKPFALMARDIEMVRQHVAVGDQEAVLLQGSAAPVLILDALRPTAVAPGVAPEQNSLGFMLPYTPLHHLLMAGLERPIVLTSGNRSDEPQCISNQDARRRLAGIADYLLLHDREIRNRLDDSVVRVMAGRPRLLRRARGYVPAPAALPTGFERAPPLLAMGGELKNTFCLLQQGRAVVSQHIGDLEDAATQRDYRHNLNLFRQLFDHRPRALAIDAHPDYLSTQLGQQLAAEHQLQLCPVQHHHAHVAACMAEHGLPLDGKKVIGITLDGLGFGADGTLWGGEFLLADYHGYRRLASFQPVPMPGGAKAVYQPWRNGYAHLRAAFEWSELERRYRDLPIVALLAGKPLATLEAMLERGLNSPLASSAGRLFDAVAAVLGLHAEQTGYEGQAAVALECLAEAAFPGQRGNAYDFMLDRQQACWRICWRRMWQGLLDDLRSNCDPALVAARFHWTLVHAVVDTAGSLAEAHSAESVVLSGGVFQNRLLLDAVHGLLRQRGFEILVPKRFPSNDGGLSLGQAVVAAAQLMGAADPAV